MKYVILTITIAVLLHIVTAKPSPQPVYAEIDVVKKQNITQDITIPKNEPQIVNWTVNSSPNSYVSVDQINNMLNILQNKGLTKEGASYLTGNFITESFLTPCDHAGDGGLAYGLGQWHPARRYDMPCGLNDQVEWALTVEMVRDSVNMNYTCVCDTVKGSDIEAIKYSLEKWERWGILGNRWYYADYIYQQIL